MDLGASFPIGPSSGSTGSGWAPWTDLRAFLGRAHALWNRLFQVSDSGYLPDLDDADLVAIAMKKGDRGRHAFDVLVERHAKSVYRLLYRLLRERGAADDVTQEAFVVAYQRLERLREPHKFGGWVHRIATRRAFNAQRNQKLRNDYEERAELARSMSGGSPLGPEEYTGAAEAVWKVLGRLSYPFREIIVLRYLEELSVTEIAERLNIGASAAKMRLKRARDEFQVLYTSNVTV